MCAVYWCVMKRYAPLGVVAAIIVGTLVVGATFVLASHATTPVAVVSQAPVVVCAETGSSHAVTIHDGVVSPLHTRAKLCDKLMIMNADAEVRLLAFGRHSHHQPYDGVGEHTLTRNQRLTVVLNQAGTYTFHDHINDMVVGMFTVTP
jgi:hypothetical protein